MTPHEYIPENENYKISGQIWWSTFWEDYVTKEVKIEVYARDKWYALELSHEEREKFIDEFIKDYMKHETEPPCVEDFALIMSVR